MLDLSSDNPITPWPCGNPSMTSKTSNQMTYHKAAALIGRGALPSDFDQWSLTSDSGNPIALEAAKCGALPPDFDQWEIANKAGWTVAHQAGVNGYLPTDFDQWYLKDDEGLTVAHVTAAHGYLPGEFSLWDIATDSKWTVAHAAARKGLLPPDFNRWFLTTEDGETVAEQHVNSFVIGFFAADRLRYEAVRLARLPECALHLVNNPFDIGYPGRKQRLNHCVCLQRELQAAEVVEQACADKLSPSHTKPRMI